MSTDRVMTPDAATQPADRSDEEALVTRARAGEATAFAEIVRRHQEPVYRAALAALGSPADAEEAAQDTFVVAFRRLDAFRGESSLRTWLLAIAWRKALTRRRRLYVWRKLIASPARDEPPEALEHVAAAGPGPDVHAATRELRGRLRLLIRALPSKLRDALLLAASGAYSYDEIAAMLDIPVGTVKWRVSEARRVLREKLRALGYDR
jgi:RNA polymerase sigma-70 factor, ECF subfamily